VVQISPGTVQRPPAPIARGTDAIILFRALPGLGDFLCVVPTLRALRAAAPSARIHLVGLSTTRTLAGRFSRYIDAFHPFPGYPGLPEQAVDARGLVRFLDTTQGLEAALALQLHGSGDRTNDIVELFGARAVAGFRRADERSPDDRRFLVWDDDEPEIHRGLRLLRHLGVPAEDDRLEFPLDPAARARAAELVGRGTAGDRPYVVVHPGSHRPDARWEVAGFAQVAARLWGRGHLVVLTGGAGEADLTAAIARSVPDAIDLAGRTDLDALGWIVRGAALLVANDTGVAHVASALGTPSVITLTAATAAVRRRWAPRVRQRHVQVAGSAADVIDAAERLLARARQAA
jgi:ADP-heptose:LPS heptosyltransferase